MSRPIPLEQPVTNQVLSGGLALISHHPPRSRLALGQAPGVACGPAREDLLARLRRHPARPLRQVRVELVETYELALGEEARVGPRVRELRPAQRQDALVGARGVDP